MTTPTSLYDIDHLLPALEKGIPILTPNRRLRAKILSAYDQHQSQRLSAWPTPMIEPLETWLHQQLDSAQQITGALPLRRILSNSQAQWLWMEAIASSSPSHGLLRLDETAQLALSAYQQLILWQQNIDHAELQSTEDSRQFVEWAKNFESLCDEHQCQLLAQGISNLFSSLSHITFFPWPDSVWLVEFDDIPPLYQSLIQQCIPNHEIIQHPGVQGDASLIQVSDRFQEFRHAAVWARNILQQQPNSVIGIIALKLNEWRQPIEQAFNEVFEPQSLSPDIPRYTSPYNFSAGEPLGECPIIHSAILSLWFLNQDIPLDILSHLLLSPFLFSSTNSHWVTHAQLEALLRQDLNNAIAVRHLKSLCALEGPVPSQTLWEKLQHLDELKRLWYKPVPASQWVLRLRTLLSALGWPGERRLDSIEYQQVAQWYESLRALESFDDFTASLNWQEFYHLLSQLSKQSVFQAQTPDSPIQILGMLEGAGLKFTHLWIIGLDDRAWPPPASPNPFIPAQWQHQLNMPHASSQRELSYAQQLTQKYASSAPSVVFSYSEREGEETLRPSPLITNYPICSIEDFDLQTAKQPFLSEITDKTVQLDKQEDAYAPPVTVGELSGIKGGSNLLKSQASCPFSAFAIHRLNAKPLGTPQLGLPAWEMGEAVHLCLEKFWRRIRTQDRLMSLSDHDVESMLIPIIEEALSYLIKKHPRLMKQRYTELQRIRLKSLIFDWLALEKTRPNFKVVRLEQEVSVSFSDLVLNLRIDRIDRTHDGKILLIDYKTNKPPISSWFGQRPNEPQLPLYFIGLPHTPETLSFAHVNSKQCEFTGITIDNTLLPGTKPLEKIRNLPEELSWNTLQTYWHQILNQLAQDFLNGIAAVDPKNNEGYAYSGLRSLARLSDFPELADTWSPSYQMSLLPHDSSNSN